MKKLSAFDLGYVTCLFERHGHIRFRTRAKPNFTVSLQIVFACIDTRVLNRAAAILGHGTVKKECRYQPHGGLPRRHALRYCGHAEIAAFLIAIRPHSPNHRAQFDLVLRFIESRRSHPGKRDPYTAEELQIVAQFSEMNRRKFSGQGVA